MSFENIFILPNVIGDRSRRRFGGIFIKSPKVTTGRSSLLYIASRVTPVWYSSFMVRGFPGGVFQVCIGTLINIIHNILKQNLFVV